MMVGGILVWAHMREDAKCRFCKRPIVWRVNRATGKSLPFDPGAFVFHTERDEVRGLQFELLSRDNLHFVTCPRHRSVPVRTVADRLPMRRRSR
jgi:hypothetical protein